MKLSLLDRFLLFLCMLVTLCTGIGIIFVVTGSYTFVELARELDYMLKGIPGVLAAIAVAVIVICVSLKLLLAVFIAKRPVEGGTKLDKGYQGGSGSTILLKATNDGDIVVSNDVIREMAVRKARSSNKVKDVTCRVLSEKEGARLYMRFMLMHDTVVDEFMTAMQEEIKTYIEKYAGVTVLAVDICVSATDDQPKGRVR